MKIKVHQSSRLRASLIGLVMCSATVAVHAANPQLPSKPAYTLKIVTHGEDANRSDNFSEPKRQDNRRADVTIKTQIQTGTRTELTETIEEVKVKVSDAVNRSIRLEDGGVIWVSKDPANLEPTLNVTAPSTVQMDGGAFVNPMNFTVKTNYAYFIDSWELAIYKEGDKDNVIATFMGRDLTQGRTIKWKAEENDNLHTGDKLVYVLKVKDKAGRLDETREHVISLVGANDSLAKELALKNSSESITKNNVAKNTTANSISAENDLIRQTIPVHGSRVRIFGRDIAAGNKIMINDESIALREGMFVTEQLLPEGQHNFKIEVTDANQNTYSKPLDVDVKGKYMFMVALADVTVGQGKVSGNLESLSESDKHLDGDIFVDGRVAFYLKGKVKGKYLITAQMDTGTAAIGEMFDDIHKKDPRSLFRRLDPDKYYPVYGDDSTIIDDTNSQGKMYVRVDWDKSRAIWGNYNTDMTGTELSSFNRSLYGAKLNHKSPATTKDGDHKTDVTVFASEAQSAFRHNQFLGTGGSLYYLKDSDIVKGSEKVWIEVRGQNGSERAIKKVVLEEGRDYEIDDFQGRIILHRPLLQIASQSGPSLVKDTPLSGNSVYLMVDYEYVPSNFNADKASYGARGKVWVNDHIAVGASYAHEKRDQGDYDLKGVDITLKQAIGTYLKAEYAKSKANQTRGSFISSDGGLNFNNLIDPANAVGSEGSAYSLEARANLQKLIDKHGSIGAWYKERKAGFSTANLSNGADTKDAGVEAIIDVTERVKLSTRATLLDKKDQTKTITASAQADVRLSESLSIGGELRYVDEHDKTNNKRGKGALGAFKVGYDVNKDVNLYVIAQGTLKKSGAYEDNNLLTIGSKAKISDKLDVEAELSKGDRGDAAKVGAKYQLTKDYSVYTNFIHSTDSTDNKRSTFTVGQKKTVSDQLSVYTEHQFTHENKQSGVGHTFGLDYKISSEATANASVQTAKLDKKDSGLTDRSAFSVGLNYIKDKTSASTQLEYRRDKGKGANAENTEQWVTTNKLKYRLSPSLRLQGKFNYAETKDKQGNKKDAKFTEAALGFALRPIENDRLNVLGRLTYLYDLQPLSQGAKPDERSLTASVESNYQLNQKWQVGGKLAHKKGEIREDRATGQWHKNDATLAAARMRYHLTHKWDAMAEYHWMNSKEAKDTQHGAMLSVDRHIGENMKVGVGYNFTNFNDDLSDTTGTAKGWFVNILGKY